MAQEGGSAFQGMCCDPEARESLQPPTDRQTDRLYPTRGQPMKSLTQQNNRLRFAMRPERPATGTEGGQSLHQLDSDSSLDERRNQNSKGNRGKQSQPAVVTALLARGADTPREQRAGAAPRVSEGEKPKATTHCKKTGSLLHEQRFFLSWVPKQFSSYLHSMCIRSGV